MLCLSEKQKWFCAALVFAVGIAMLFRFAWLPGPYRSIGDNGDGVLTIATLEHWKHYFDGSVSDFTSLAWFWPTKNTLGYTDTYFLMALPYAAARELGADEFASYDITVGTLAAIGFWTFLALLKRLSVGTLVSAVFAYVFAFGSLVIFKLGHHGQTYALMLIPALALMLSQALREVRSKSRCVLWAALSGLWFGLLAFTAPESAWFLSFEGLLIGLITLGLSHHYGLLKWKVIFQQSLPITVGGFIGLIMGLTPAVLVYAQTFTERQRTWSEAFQFMPGPTDVLNVSPENLLWYHALSAVGIAREPSTDTDEIALGFTPGFLLAAIVAFIILIRRRRKCELTILDFLALSCLAASAVSWLITFKITYNVSGWHLVHLLVPGANGIRTPFRIQLISLFFMGAASSYVFSSELRQLVIDRKLAKAATLCALLVVCALEQTTSGPPSRDTGEMRRWLDTLQRPDFPCDVFYLLPQKGNNRAWNVRQSDAMLLSQRLGMPTVNGNSSWYPAGWDLSKPDKSGYRQNLQEWISAHGSGYSFCGVDPQSGVWQLGLFVD
jgi:hypothetical protein